MDYIAAGATDVGCVREKNEDSFLLDEPIGSTSSRMEWGGMSAARWPLVSR